MPEQNKQAQDRPDVGSHEELISRPFGMEDGDLSAHAGALPNLDDQDGDRALAQPWDDQSELDLVAHYPLEELVEKIQQGARRVEITGVHGGARGALLAQLQAKTGKRIIAITPDTESGQKLVGDLSLFIPEELRKGIVFFPSSDVSPYSGIAPDRRIVQDRLKALFSLNMDIGGEFVVLTVSEMARKTMPAEYLLELSDVVSPDADGWTNERFSRILTDGGYTAVPLVEDPGTFALRGDIVDIWSPFDPLPLRIERWGDEIVEIKTFDPSSQRTQKNVNECYILPVREEVLTSATLECAREKLTELGHACHFPSKEIRRIFQDLQAGLHFLGIEALLPAFYPELSPLHELLPNDAILAIIEPATCLDRVDGILEQRHKEHQHSLEQNQLVFPVEDHYLTLQELQKWLHQRPQTLALQRLRIAGESDAPHLEFRTRSNSDIVKVRRERQGAEGAVHAIAPLLETWRQIYGRIAFVCHTAGDTERLSQLLEAYEQKIAHHKGPLNLGKTPTPPGILSVQQGDLSSGFRSPALGYALIAGHEVFGKKVHQGTTAKTFQETSAISSFRELNPGDAVVHADFGLGRYGGLHKMTVGGVPGDFLLIEYSGRDKLYLPVYRLGRVQKYLGKKEGTRLDKLGGSKWEQVKERIKAQLRELAVDLIALYARRQTNPGTAFSSPDNYYREFEAAFPYDATPDQQQAIEATLRDMQRKTVMDRLICGDVGFGKTEVAMRAAFMAVLSGYQVSVLVPTTVLCEQHLASFRKRFQGYPVRIEAISRFRSRSDTTKILKETEKGQVDILIGTHRILSKDVQYNKLGLLIVDEEQRFGVGHKEKIKAMRTQVDCLTLSATPIPRTLQMSLLGIRDMSIIATPPPGRLAVRTHIARFGETVIREAIMRELQRGGQVYFVHNRVQTIYELADRLKQIVPEARIAVGHGQMKEGELEKIMLGFVQGRYNVLLSTTIIESGIDIPNANTMLIDRADNFGLSQLYQLRGRIGRSAKRAYCYLLVHGKKLTDIAQERLEVIERFSDLGSGFHVASYDLEIRGAGNILGPQQSGNVAAVGLDLYSELLEEAIKEVQGEEVQTEVEPEVNIPVPAYIPEGYIQDTSLRLLFYKRLSLARTEEELFDLYSELVDRFGEAPPEVESLREVIAVKIALKKLRCHRLDTGAGTVHVTLGSSPAILPGQAMGLIQQSRGRYSLTPQMKLIRRLAPNEAQDQIKAARLVCRELLQAAELL